MNITPSTRSWPMLLVLPPLTALAHGISPWQAVKHDKAEVVEGKKGREWKVTFKNPAVTDKSKETLYMFYTVPGNFIAANFTGQ
jgi:Family of unknown function (DUF6488)